jgi:hypothetical protein
MYTLRFHFENNHEEDIDFAGQYTKEELRKIYNYETRTFKGIRSKVTLIEVYRFEELIFEYPTTNVIGLFDTNTILYNQIKRDEEYCRLLYQQMTDYFIHGKMYQGD